MPAMKIDPHKAAWAARMAESFERPQPRTTVPYVSDRQYAMEQRARGVDAALRAQEALRYRKLQARYLGISLDELDEMLERDRTAAARSASAPPGLRIAS